MNILNLTQHQATPDQLSDGVFEPAEQEKEAIKCLLTFDTLPSAQSVSERAAELAHIASLCMPDAGQWYAMIGGAPFFMSALEAALLDLGITPLYSFSIRESAEEVQVDGVVKKTNVFKHVGFVECLNP